MDEQLKKKIYQIIILVSILILLYVGWGLLSLKKQREEGAIIVNRSALINFRLLGLNEDNGYFMDLVNMDSGKKYEKIFLSKICPNAKKNELGKIMKLSVLEYFNPSTNEKFYMMDRAYDYLCTNKDMNKEDEILLKNIEKAKERYLNDLYQSNPSLAPPAEIRNQ